MSKLIEYKKALDNYYYLKAKYEKPKKNVTIPVEKKCVKCGKKGGTEFLRKVEKGEKGRKEVYLIAKCNADNPCKLDINIKLSNYKLYETLVKSIKSQMEEIKGNIIKLKLDLLFQLKDEDYVVNKFEQLKNKLQSLSKKYIFDCLQNYFTSKEDYDKCIEFINNSRTRTKTSVLKTSILKQ